MTENVDRYPKIREIAVWWIIPAGLVLAAASHPLFDPDMWWHLAAGREILDGHFPVTNTFSHTFPDHSWRFTQWLFGVLIAGAEKLGGFVAVQAVVFLFAAGTFLLVVATVRRDAPLARWHFVLPFFAIGVLAARFRFAPRGDLATLLGLAAVHYLWVVRPRKLPLYLFLVACLWSNLHAGVVFGVLEIGILGGAALLDRDRKSSREALGCGIAFLAGSLVNPFFFYPYLYVVENIEVARHFPMPIDELKPPGLLANPPFTLLTFLAPVAGIVAILRKRYRHAMLIGVSLAIAWWSLRFIPFLPILGLSGIVAAFDDARETLGAKFGRMAGPVLAALALVAAIAFGVTEWRKLRPGWGADLTPFPAGAADYALSRGFAGRMFNEFDQGGFLAWKLFPKQRVFVDGRGNAYPWDHFRQCAGYNRGALEKMLGKYHVDFAVVQRRPFGAKVDLGSTFGAMGWELVHMEGASFLFVRRGSPDAMRARGDVFRLMMPWDHPDKLTERAVAQPVEVAGELSRIEPRSLVDPAEFNIFGICASLAGDNAQAIRFLEEALRRFPGHLQARYNYAIVLASVGRAEDSLRELRRIIEAGPDDPLAAKARYQLQRLRR